MEIDFKGQVITDDAIVDALREFAALYSNTNDYESWLEKGSYKYAIQHEGNLYPPKHILSRVSGIDTTEFSGGEQTNRVFRELGFTVIDKP